MSNKTMNKTIVALVLLAGSVARAQTYTAVDLGNLGRAYTRALGINDSAQITGQSGLPAYQPNPSTSYLPYDAFLWEAGSMLDLGTLPAGGDVPISFGRRVNTAGHVVGASHEVISSKASTIHAMRAFFWSSGKMVDLGTLGGTNSGAWDVNDADVVVGEADDASGVTTGALWKKTRTKWTVQALPSAFASVKTVVRAINNTGSAVGYARDPAYPYNDIRYRPILWQQDAQGNWSASQLSTAITSNAYAADINDAGIAVGWGYYLANEAALVWQAGGVQALPDLGTGWAQAFAVNDGTPTRIAGQSESLDGTWHAVVWAQDATGTWQIEADLGNMGGSTASANAINIAGNVAGDANYPDGSYRGFYWHR